MKNEIKEIILHSENDFVEDIENLIKEEKAKAANKTGFICTVGFVVVTAIFHLIN